MAADSPVYRQSATFVTAPLDDELALLDVRSGTYFGLNSTAAAIWRLLERPVGVDGICAALTQDFEVDQADCRAGVERALRDLLRRGLIERADA